MQYCIQDSDIQNPPPAKVLQGRSLHHAPEDDFLEQPGEDQQDHHMHPDQLPARLHDQRFGMQDQVFNISQEYPGHADQQLEGERSPGKAQTDRFALQPRGAPVIVASKRLGHSLPSTTLDVYGNLYHELQNDAAKIMDDLVVPSAIKAPFTITVP